MKTRQLGWFCVGGLLWAAQAGAQPATAMQLPSCVNGSPPMKVSADAPNVRLDGADRSRFHAAASARYPLYQRGGLVPSEVLLLQLGGHWLYIAISPLDVHGPCFTAVFAAERFDFTDHWLAKYRPRVGADDL